MENIIYSSEVKKFIPPVKGKKVIISPGDHLRIVAYKLTKNDILPEDIGDPNHAYTLIGCHYAHKDFTIKDLDKRELEAVKSCMGQIGKIVEFRSGYKIDEV